MKLLHALWPTVMLNALRNQHMGHAEWRRGSCTARASELPYITCSSVCGRCSNEGHKCNILLCELHPFMVGIAVRDMPQCPLHACMRPRTQVRPPSSRPAAAVAAAAAEGANGGGGASSDPPPGAGSSQGRVRVGAGCSAAGGECECCVGPSGLWVRDDGEVTQRRDGGRDPPKYHINFSCCNLTARAACCNLTE